MSQYDNQNGYIIRSEEDLSCRWDSRPILFNTTEEVQDFINTFPTFFDGSVKHSIVNVSTIGGYDPTLVVNIKEVDKKDFEEEIENRS